MAKPISATAKQPTIPRVDVHFEADGRVMLRCRGGWRLDRAVPPVAAMRRELSAAADLSALGFDATELESWDSTLVAYVIEIRRWARAQGLDVSLDGLPDGVRTLVELASAVPRRGDDRQPLGKERFLARLGLEFVELVKSTGEIVAFVGRSVLAVRQLLLGKARFRGSDFWLIVQQVGADALPIVSLVSFLVGLILAYIGTQQLAQFGARIFVANLVGLAMVIQMGALITAIVLAGRTGAAFAAQLGTMQVNEEIDALRTLGLSPMEFLVLPRMLALVLMTPLLAIYATLLGILGGAFVVVVLGGVTGTEYLNQTQAAIGLNHVVQGLTNATVYGAIVAISGCLRGMQCGRSAAAVGLATTSAVVTAIVFIVVAAAVLTILFNALGL